MLDEERIKKAQSNMKKYMEDSLIWKTKIFKKEILATYKRNYKESLDVAKKLLDENLSNLWIIVTSYYSMYYVSNAALYQVGYKIGHKISHKITADALIVLIRDKLKKSLLEDYEESKEEALELIGRKTDSIISDFSRELDKRAIFQYQSTEKIKRAKAETSFERAKKFVFEMEKLL